MGICWKFGGTLREEGIIEIWIMGLECGEKNSADPMVIFGMTWMLEDNSTL